MVKAVAPYAFVWALAWNSVLGMHVVVSAQARRRHRRRGGLDSISKHVEIADAVQARKRPLSFSTPSIFHS